MICVSAALADRHRDAPRPVTHIPNGVGTPTPHAPELIRERWGLERGSYVLFAGRVSPEKGVHHLVRAFAQVPGDRRLVVAGGTSHTDDYLDALRREADDRVLLVGYQEGAALAELFTNAAAFVLPSDHEGMPVALLEAWSYGLPTLASGIEPCREVGGDEGERTRYFTPGDVNDLAGKLTDLLADTDASAMGDRAKTHVLAHYGWDAIATRVAEQYRLAVEGA